MPANPTPVSILAGRVSVALHEGAAANIEQVSSPTPRDGPNLGALIAPFRSAPFRAAPRDARRILRLVRDDGRRRCTPASFLLHLHRVSTGPPRKEGAYRRDEARSAWNRPAVSRERKKENVWEREREKENAWPSLTRTLYQCPAVFSRVLSADGTSWRTLVVRTRGV